MDRDLLRWCLLAVALSAPAQTVPYKPVKFKPVPVASVEARLQKFGGNDAQREATLKQMFADAGCDNQHLSEQAVKGSKSPNVICVLPGSGNKTIIVGAHFDHVASGSGVVDNWSGASLLPSLYEAVKSESRKHTYIFIGFTDEERGMVGSKFYAEHMTKEEVAATEAMVNIDTLGLGPTAIWATHSDPELIRAIVYISGPLNLTIERVNVEQVGSSDSEQFAARKIPRITVHSLTQETWDARILHTEKDNISAMRLDDYYQSYRLLSGYLAYLDEFLLNLGAEAK